MKDEINNKKGAKIYCIYFDNPDFRNDSTDDPKNIVKKISELGGTGGTYKFANSLPTLVTAFSDISKAIETNFKLEYLKKKNN